MKIQQQFSPITITIDDLNDLKLFEYAFYKAMRADRFSCGQNSEQRDCERVYRQLTELHATTVNLK